ncbi:MAG: helix-turn-helix domain-containing protein [Actinomycetota bacterium]
MTAPHGAGDGTRDEFLTALRSAVAGLGATVVTPRASRPGDQPVRWRGDVVAYLRVSELHGALARLVRAVEEELGASLAEMSRAEKQVAVRLLDEQGAFLLRGAVEDVAGWMGVSRVTLYNYLNAIERARADAER